MVTGKRIAAVLALSVAVVASIGFGFADQVKPSECTV